MRVFLAGASGVIGVRLVALLVAAGHEVTGMTRAPAKVALLRDAGAEPVVCDVLLVLEAGGVVLRYGTFSGPGTFGGDRVPPPPCVHVDEAARRTVALLDAPSGVVEVVDP